MLQGLFSEDYEHFAGISWSSFSSPGVQDLLDAAGLIISIGATDNDMTTVAYKGMLDDGACLLSGRTIL